MKIIELKETVTASNDRDADALRAEMKAKGTLLINLMSSPGAGKTTLLEHTIADLRDSYTIAVLEADVDSAVDAERIEKLGVKALQVHTGGMCHMDAGMTREGLEEMGCDGIDLVFLENVGNLICPAEFDTGAGKKVMILSTPEGDDKPLKYPLMFRESDVLIISKSDVARFFDFDYDKCIERAKKLNPDIKIFRLSSKTGEGFEEWEEWLTNAVNEWKGNK
ncbi:MAG: hydrogenase nickel incorporation protein HypB [Clostridia bacterium]|nr:hydrogenase nickel incorporation protein HypB [Clostridia bacterium]